MDQRLKDIQDNMRSLASGELNSFLGGTDSRWEKLDRMTLAEKMQYQATKMAQMSPVTDDTPGNVPFEFKPEQKATKYVDLLQGKAIGEERVISNEAATFTMAVSTLLQNYDTHDLEWWASSCGLEKLCIEGHYGIVEKEMLVISCDFR